MSQGLTNKLSRVAAEKAQCAQEAVPHLEGHWVVTVCDHCCRASCWQGELYCDNYRTAGTKRITIGEAKGANLESPTWWTKDEEVIPLLLAKGIYA